MLTQGTVATHFGVGTVAVDFCKQSAHFAKEQAPALTVFRRLETQEGPGQVLAEVRLNRSKPLLP
jgi:hypothetical protein